MKRTMSHFTLKDKHSPKTVDTESKKCSVEDYVQQKKPSLYLNDTPRVVTRSFFFFLELNHHVPSEKTLDQPAN